MKLIEIKKQVEFFERLNICYNKNPTGAVTLKLAVGISIINDSIPLDIDSKIIGSYLTEINNAIKEIGKKYIREIKLDLIEECKKLEKEMEN